MCQTPCLLSSGVVVLFLDCAWLLAGVHHSRVKICSATTRLGGQYSASSAQAQLRDPRTASLHFATAATPSVAHVYRLGKPSPPPWCQFASTDAAPCSVSVSKPLLSCCVTVFLWSCSKSRFSVFGGSDPIQIWKSYTVIPKMAGNVYHPDPAIAANSHCGSFEQYQEMYRE